MRTALRTYGLVGAMIVAMVAAEGCGGSSGPAARQDILDTPADELHGASTKGMIYDFRTVVRANGVQGAQQELPILLENFEGYEDQPVGDHVDTYRQIVEKLQAMEMLLAGSPSDEDVMAAVDEISALADTLPGEAEAAPLAEDAD